jgi:hypothetical protein
LVRFGARDYDVETGRWTAKDPILFESVNRNLYEYVSGDPVNSFDCVGMEQTVLGGGQATAEILEQIKKGDYSSANEEGYNKAGNKVVERRVEMLTPTANQYIKVGIPLINKALDVSVKIPLDKTASTSVSLSKGSISISKDSKGVHLNTSMSAKTGNIIRSSASTTTNKGCPNTSIEVGLALIRYGIEIRFSRFDPSKWWTKEK